MNNPATTDEEKTDRSAVLGQFSEIAWLWPYLLPYRRQVLLACIALFVAAATVLALGIGIRTLIDDGMMPGDTVLLDYALFVLIVIVLVLACSSFARFYLVTWVGERVVADVRRDVYARVIRMPPSFFEITRTGEVLSRLTTDTTVLQTVVGSTLSMAARNALMLVGCVVMLAITSFKLTAIVVFLVPIVLLPIMVFGRRVRSLSRLSQDRVADVGHRVDETLNAIPTVQAFASERFEEGNFRMAVEKAFGVAIQRTRARAFLTAFVILFMFGGVAGVLWIGGHDVVAGNISGGELAAFVFYAVVAAGASASLSDVYGELQRAAGAAERLGELLAATPEISSPEDPESFLPELKTTIAIENATFHYRMRSDESAINNISLDIDRGETVAIVGPSGSGKSTLFSLLLRFHDVQTGSIRIDGVELRHASLDALRNRVALVPQEPVIFGTTIRENIRYGNPDATDNAVRKAAEAAFALEFIVNLPDGFETFVGERGVRLSGGQRQRIAIARAILKDSPILLLDEATSALDAESETVVQHALERLMIGRTTLVIAHRLSTILNADRIVVLDHGRIVESGRHEELVARNGLYTRLAELQFDGVSRSALRVSGAA